MPSIHGRTAAHYDNPHRHQTLAGATLVFYGAGTVDAHATQAGRTRLGWRALDALPAGALGHATVEPDGRYCLRLEHYEGAPLLVALDVKKLGSAPETGTAARGLLGVAQPRKTAGEWTLDLDVPRPAYCALLGALDLWLVAGRVTDCHAREARPLVGGSVTAWSCGLEPADALGSATTDASGSFEIFFAGSAFRRIPSLPPPFDAILPHELVGGPDVFFQVRQGTERVLDEPRTRGRERDRENRRNCSYLELCAAPPRVPALSPAMLWTHVGEVAVTGLEEAVDVDGDVAFQGLLTSTYLGEPVSFRFVHAEWKPSAPAPRYPRDYQPLTPAHLQPGRPYAYLRRQVGPSVWDCMLEPVYPRPDADGWIAVSQDPGLIHLGLLISLRSGALVPGDSPGRDMAGESTLRFSFVLEVRTASHVLHQPVPVTLRVGAPGVLAVPGAVRPTATGSRPAGPPGPRY